MTEAARRYHYAWPTRFRKAVPLISMIWPILGSIVGVILCGTSASSQQGVLKNFYYGAAIICGLIGLLFTIVSILTVIRLFANYIELSPDGVNFLYFGNFRVRAKWTDIERLGPLTVLKGIVALHPAKADISEPFFYRWRQSLYKKPYVIPVSDFEGWPDGELAAALRHYAPQLFEEKVDGSESARQTG
jgi:hypothetical protein